MGVDMSKDDVVIGITADASGLEVGVRKSKRSLADLGKSAREASQTIGTVGDGGEKSAKKIERDTRSMQQSLQRYIATLKAGSKESRIYWEQMADFKGVDKNALRPLLNQLDELKRKQQEAAGASGSLVASLKGLHAAAAVAVSGFAVQGLISVTKELYNASAAAERLRIGLDFASSRGSVNEIAYLRDVTHRLGLEFYSTAQAYQQFQAASRGTALEGDKARAVFESVAKAAAVMGLSADNTSGVLLALQQMISKGNVQAEELRGQLGERLPGAFQIAAKSMGVTTAELGKMLENGQVLADDFLPKFAAELERSLGDAPEKAANRLDASVNRAISAWTRFKENVGDSGVSQFWAGQMDILSDGLANFNQRIEAARAAGDGFGGQMLSAAAAALEFVNPINAVSYSALEAGSKLKEAEKRLQELKDAGAKTSSNLMLRESYAHAERLVNKLREAKAVQDALAGINPANAAQPLRDLESGNTRGNRDGYYRELSASQNFLAQRNDGINKQFIADLNGLAKAYADGALSAAEYAKAVTEANQKRHESTEAGKAEAKAAREAAKGLKEGENSIKSFIKSLEAKTAAQRLEIAQGEKLTESQRLRIQLEALLADGKNKATAGQIARAKAQLAEVEANEAWLKNTSDVEKALADMQKAREQSLRSVQESVRQMVEEAEAAAYAEVHNVSLAEAVERLALARAENAYQQAVERGESQQMLDYLHREIEARKELVAATAQKAAREANKKAAEQAAKDWERVSQTIGDTLADYIMAGGKDAAQYLKRLFATLVLQPVVNYGVQGAMGMLGMGPQAAGASSVGNALGTVNNLSSLYSAFSGGLVSSVGGAIGSLGATFGSSALTSFAAGMKGSTLAAGLAGPTTAGAGGAMGLGASFGAALPWLAGGLAIASLFGGSFGSRGANHSGGAYSTKGGNAAYQLGLGGDALRDFTSRGNASIANSVKGLVTTTVSAFDYLKKYSSTYKGVDVAAGFAVNPRYGDEDAYGYFRVLDKVTGKLLSNYVRRDGGLGSDTTKAWSTYSADLIKAVYGQFKKSDITGWVKDELAVLDSAASLENLTAAVQAIAVIDAAFADFAKTVDGMQDLSGAVQTVLLRTSGGIEALSANVATYYQNFYSEQERAAKTAGQLAEALKEYGVELPTTAEQYRDLVEQQLAAGESGAELAAVLLGMSGTFKEVSAVWQRELEGLSGSVTSFFGSLKDAIKSLIDDVSDDRKSILRGTGVMTAEELRAAIGAISTVGPSLTMVSATQTAAIIAAQRVAAAEQASKSKTQLVAPLSSAVDKTKQEIAALDKWFAGVQSSFDSFIAYRNWAWSGAGKYSESMALVPENARRQAQYRADKAQYDTQMAAAQARLAQEQAALNAATSQAAAYAQQLAEAQRALAAAQQAEQQARIDYAAEMAKWVEEAGVSVGKLSDLRGEVMSFYEAQAQAVQAMLASAGNIRAVVDAVRLNQLSAAQTAQELGARYAMDYSMALATTGTARAGYVDSMAGNLGVLSEALRSESVTSTDWRVQTAKLLAQANKAADLLEGDAQGDNYQDVALGLLDDIDAKLEALSGVATAGENLIVQAIKEGTVSTLDGLRAVVAALKGDPVPAFAAGGLHAGGLRLVGERGPELEVTGPARYWSTSQTAAMLGGGGNSDAVVRELRELREENRALQEAMVRQQADMTRLLMRWETQGMPEERMV